MRWLPWAEKYAKVTPRPDDIVMCSKDSNETN